MKDSSYLSLIVVLFAMITSILYGMNRINFPQFIVAVIITGMSILGIWFVSNYELTATE